MEAGVRRGEDQNAKRESNAQRHLKKDLTGELVNDGQNKSTETPLSVDREAFWMLTAVGGLLKKRGLPLCTKSAGALRHGFRPCRLAYVSGWELVKP